MPAFSLARFTLDAAHDAHILHMTSQFARLLYYHYLYCLLNVIINRLPGDETFRHVQIDGVQRYTVHRCRYVDDDVYLAVERRVSALF